MFRRFLRLGIAFQVVAKTTAALCVVAVVFTMVATSGLVRAETSKRTATEQDFVFDSLEGGKIAISDYRGQAVLVVNTASFCGFTPQYEGLQALYDRYRDSGFVVLAIPSNDFGNQEPGTANEIKEFCEVNYDITFPITQKQKVRGRDRHPFYNWTANALGAAGAPRWNFHKVLLGREGNAITGFPPTVQPTSKALTQAIEQALVAE